jgi:hypothetical protein
MRPILFIVNNTPYKMGDGSTCHVSSLIFRCHEVHE